MISICPPFRGGIEDAMGRPANFEIVEDLPYRVVLRDLGPWTKHFTITNDAENVVAQLAKRVGQRRLFYFDSEGELTELIHKAGKFVRFAPALL